MHWLSFAVLGMMLTGVWAGKSNVYNAQMVVLEKKKTQNNI